MKHEHQLPEKLRRNPHNDNQLGTCTKCDAQGVLISAQGARESGQPVGTVLWFRDGKTIDRVAPQGE